jgi:RHS repeat-associated protein
LPCRLPPAFVVGRAEFVAPFPQAGNRVACSTSYKFTGYERDSETGLDYAFARYYNSRLGRFMSGDPGPRDLSDPQTLNRYSYTRNNPVNLTDPMGLCSSGPGGISCTSWGSPEPDSFVGQVGTGGAAGIIGTWKIPGCMLVIPEYQAAGRIFDVQVCEYRYADGPKPQRPVATQPSPAPTPAPPPAQAQAPQPDRLVCAAQLADKYSLAGLVGTIGKTGVLANVFNGIAGNSVSGLVMMFNHGNKYRTVTAISNAPAPVGFAWSMGAINAATAPARTTELNLTGVEEFANFAGDGLGGIAFVAKLTYDAVSFTGAYIACGR